MANRLSLSLQTKKSMLGAISSAAGFGGTCNRRILTSRCLTFCQELCSPEACTTFQDGERIREVEHADFNFTCTGGMAPQCHLIVKRLAEQLSKKQNIQQSVVSGWLRCRLSFALLRTTLLCVRATRRKRFVVDNNIELAVSESKIEY